MNKEKFTIIITFALDSILEDSAVTALSRPILRFVFERAGIGEKTRCKTREEEEDPSSLVCRWRRGVITPSPWSKDDAVILITRMKVRPSYARSPL